MKLSLVSLIATLFSVATSYTAPVPGVPIAGSDMGKACIVGQNACDDTRDGYLRTVELGCFSSSGKARSRGVCNTSGFGFHETCNPKKIQCGTVTRKMYCKENPSHINGGKAWCVDR